MLGRGPTSCHSVKSEAICTLADFFVHGALPILIEGGRCLLILIGCANVATNGQHQQVLQLSLVGVVTSYTSRFDFA